MVTKLLPVKPWKDVVGGAKVADKGLERALADYKGFANKKPAERLTKLDSINKLVGDLKRVKEVAAIPTASKYLTDLAKALAAERLEITKADFGTTLNATLTNSSDWDDMILTVEDLNKGRDRVIVDRERLNKKDSVSVTLLADGNGKGQIKWTAQQADDAASRKEETVKDIKDDQVIKIHS